ncbi:hypothetical protein RvY_06337 [Ramazzottius varieornatus]|uniref:Uncharacterized protein n=1 Tax=Ramazzottius varieornatus TaxID=947166 RepID=A0A1D1V1Q0_RAMVA|nr:hypothetical protein RvY_06337 [Ramazzottius varieornatus]
MDDGVYRMLRDSYLGCHQSLGNRIVARAKISNFPDFGGGPNERCPRFSLLSLRRRYFAGFAANALLYPRHCRFSQALTFLHQSLDCHAAIVIESPQSQIRTLRSSEIGEGIFKRK